MEEATDLIFNSYKLSADIVTSLFYKLIALLSPHN